MARDTSRDAYRSLRPGVLNHLQGRIFGLLLSDPMTSDEIEVVTGLRHQTAAARLTELSQAGLIEDSGERRPTRSGRKAIVWRIAG